MYEKFLIESFDDPSFISDENYNIIRASHSFQQKDHLIGKNVIGMKCYEALGYSNPCPECVIQKVNKEFKNRFHEWKEPFSGRYFLTVAFPIHDTKNNKISYFHLASDITDLKFADIKLVETMKTQSRILSIISHQFRNPLSAIKAGLDLYMSNYKQLIQGNQKNMLKIIQQNTNRLVRSINNLLDFYKLDSDNLTFQWKDQNVNDILNEAYRSLHASVTQKGLDFKLELENQLPSVFVDKEKILRAVMNILHNSIKFTNSGSISVASKTIQDFVQVTIDDTGCGIQCKNPGTFFQANNTIKNSDEETNYTGLGLAISHKIIDKHHGKIWIKPKDTKGTAVSFILPIHKQP